jgi:hypothetical protein
MKKVLLLVITIATFGTLKAQDGLYAGAQFGYYLVGMSNGPATLSNASNTNAYTHFKGKYSTKEGLSVGYGILSFLAVQAELNFATLGQASTGNYGSSTLTRDINLNYVEIPIFLKLRTPGEAMHYYFMIGPQFNFLSSASITDPANVNISDAKSHFNSTDMGLTFDTGAELQIEKIMINLGLRGYYGFSDPNVTAFQLANTSGAYSSSHNFAVGLSLGAHYNF